MKTILLIIFLALTVCVFAQSDVIPGDFFSKYMSDNHVGFTEKRFNLVDKYSLDSMSDVTIDYSTNDTVQVSNKYFTYDIYGRQTVVLRTNASYPDLQTYITGKTTYEHFENPDSLVTTYFSYNQSENIFVPNMLLCYLFDENGNIIIARRYSWSASDNTWQLLISAICEFDAFGNQLYFSQMYYGNGGIVPTGGLTEINEFNSDNNLVNFLRLRYETTTQTMDSSFNTSYTYDVNGNLLTKLNREYDVGYSQWQSSFKAENIYENGHLKDSVNYYFTDNIIQPNSKTSFEYNENHRITAKIIYSWDSGLSDWYFICEESNSYDEYGRLTETINYDSDILGNPVPVNRTVNIYGSLELPSVVEYFQWDTGNSEWDTITKDTYVYDGQLRVVSRIQFDWNNVLGGFVNSQKFEYNYDFSGNQVLDCEYRWDTEYATWVTYYCYVRSYDEQYSFNDLVLPENDIDTGYFGSMLLIVERFGNNLNFDYTNYYYSQKEFENYVVNSDVTGLTIFPNPATNSIKISGEFKAESVTIQLYDITGKCVLATKAGQGEKIDLSYLDGGLYSYNLINGNNITTGKIVKY